ncbi:bifunctional biotin--[acetyl-CoA-carboxylase] ligase/biotin operon repressor BirA [Colwellia sp. MB02u-18]|uniref:bifunctional biotin--[acetyl-CoA-carboxylase] ligase/biotin operon repressor BirA n=1 Tax=unclassified Colwellia TaxID=196834 RepID=UPI0015F5545E|nr:MULTISPECIES: bifunctional biotin--[acetyl-CoA-carboxylase] ligase/biotin operon repressor BirA [unclassified Colwellia]MBA6225750.1 bifunctional biotin--[acetyl-CoA-carboxylase] ligase/biotin operon repressor BirA [Colwellia sp. MB3u-45]MBA6266998.1 bifunctional biotin--[acetyl-CoA-carboxylase] ligase/biotin operon repressor BirA [Colwellia sp. MB3u-43]MBA6321910.1 bifunctional biotin--[acetyl-CoA-carboxylase] ligase/biotin operon repressor BirA [Colwellia sp. MB02u-19]MBA6325140.1 bifuncti
MKAIREQLIKKLVKGEFLSGQAIGEELGVSRAAISKHISALQEMGFDIFSVTGKGYRLAEPIELLNESLIVAELAEQNTSAKVEVHNLIDSTNSYLMRRLPNQNVIGQVCIAEYQSAGRGRRGRQWISPFGSHIYLSMYWYLEQGMSAAMGLSVVAALAVSDAIKALYQVDVELKWPNDIYFNGVKLAGILIDLEGQAMEPCHCVIGIGLNIKMPAKSAVLVDQPWIDLSSAIGVDIDRNMLAASIIAALHRRLKVHSETGINTMVTQWHAQDFYINKPVALITGEKVTRGICRGINGQGALMLEVNGQVSPVYGGEVSLRAGL